MHRHLTNILPVYVYLFHILHAFNLSLACGSMPIILYSSILCADPRSEPSLHHRHLLRGVLWGIQAEQEVKTVKTDRQTNELIQADSNAYNE